MTPLTPPPAAHDLLVSLGIVIGCLLVILVLMWA